MGRRRAHRLDARTGSRDRIRQMLLIHAAPDLMPEELGRSKA
jgi:hypothetical protein